MPLFQCSRCGCVENTAVSNYWAQVYMYRQKPLCVECKSGKWHDLFPKEDAAATGYCLGADGFLYGPEENPHHTTIVGPVPPVEGQP